MNGLARQRGIAAVELALILPFFLVLLMTPLFFGRVFWHYSVIERAAQDGARYLSRVPLNEIRNPARSLEVAAVAQAIAGAELAELAPGPDAIGITADCDALPCMGFLTPATVSVAVQLQVTDIFFVNLTSEPLPLLVNVSMSYLGK
jgi:Flp pilus assembly protein TadG